MTYQPQISTITGTAPPSYMEAMTHQPLSKDNFPLPSSMPQPYGTSAPPPQPYESHVQPSSMGGQYPTTGITNYQEYNSNQPSYNPMFVPAAPNVRYPTQTPCVVTTTAVMGPRNKNRTCSCVRAITFTILVLILVSYLLKVIIASTNH